MMTHASHKLFEHLNPNSFLSCLASLNTNGSFKINNRQVFATPSGTGSATGGAEKPENEEDKKKEDEDKKKKEEEEKKKKEKEKEEEEKKKKKEAANDTDEDEPEEDEELFEIEIDDVTYCTNNDENGFIWELTEDGEQGDKVGYFKEGEPFFYADEN